MMMLKATHFRDPLSQLFLGPLPNQSDILNDFLLSPLPRVWLLQYLLVPLNGSIQLLEPLRPLARKSRLTSFAGIDFVKLTGEPITHDLLHLEHPVSLLNAFAILREVLVLILIKVLDNARLSLQLIIYELPAYLAEGLEHVDLTLRNALPRILSEVLPLVL